MTADPLAATLAAYRQVLGTPDVSAEDDFFQLGGDSVQAMEALAMIEEALGTELSPALFFTYPAPAELAEAIAADAGLPR